jgi:predicted dehydrogenase
MSDEKKIRWGVLGVAKIATIKVIPAMRSCTRSVVTAIASRELAKAREAATELGIPKAYGSYEELLADPDIDAIYNPLTNQLHLPWTVKAAEAGKHVLCEKPITMNTAECREMIAARDRTGVKIGEAFMVVCHPQWLRVREIARSGSIGDVRSIATFFSYTNVDPENIRNRPDCGGGTLMDIGCYAIMMSRWIFGEEPLSVKSLIEYDPAFKTDRLSSAILEFPAGRSIFTCGTQLVPYQRVMIFGTKGRIEVEIPFNPTPQTKCRIFIDDGSALAGANAVIEEFPACDQYTLQADAFSRAIQENGAVPVSLEYALKNMEAIEAAFKAG